jgi:hypothetical protein
LLILFTLSFLFSLIYLKHREFSKKLAVYLNFLFILLIFTDIGIIIFKVINYDGKEFSISTSSTIQKPNIYLIVVDEYAGEDQLKSTFHCENHLFLMD